MKKINEAIVNELYSIFPDYRKKELLSLVQTIGWQITDRYDRIGNGRYYKLAKSKAFEYIQGEYGFKRIGGKQFKSIFVRINPLHNNIPDYGIVQHINVYNLIDKTFLNNDEMIILAYLSGIQLKDNNNITVNSEEKKLSAKNIIKKFPQKKWSTFMIYKKRDAIFDKLRETYDLLGI